VANGRELNMNHQDARAKELHNLRLALATFALQLDAFEMRIRAARLVALHKTPRANDAARTDSVKELRLGAFELGTEKIRRPRSRMPLVGK
jgi:hypothetical protein